MSKAKKKTVELDELTKAAWRTNIRRTWQHICYDCLSAADNGTMEAAEVREVVADYIDDPDWWNVLSIAQRAELLAEALPFDQSI